MSEFNRIERPKARKPHRCYSCGRVIPAGEVYRRDTGLYDGDFASAATCGQCEALMVELAAHDIEDWDSGGLVYLPDLDWRDVAELDNVRLLRALALFRRRWTHRDGTVYAYPAAA